MLALVYRYHSVTDCQSSIGAIWLQTKQEHQTDEAREARRTKPSDTCSSPHDQQMCFVAVTRQMKPRKGGFVNHL